MLPSRGSNGQGDGERPIVLVVDDHDAGLIAIEGVLAGQGYDVRTARDGPSALAAAKECAPDVILLDVMMPGMDGFEVCRRIRSDGDLGSVPVIMVTALDDRASKLRGIEAGADDFLAKPIDRQELRARVRTTTSLSRFRALAAEREKVDRLFGLSPDGIVVLDDGATIIRTNEAFRQLTRVDHDPTGRPIAGYLNGEGDDIIESLVRQVLVKGDASTQARVELRCSGGNDIATEVSAGAVRWGQGWAVQWVVRDITERLHLEEALRRSQRFEDVGRLAAAIAHDFRNYLTAILSTSDVLLLESTLSAEVREDAETIRRAAQKASTVCQQLLALSSGGKDTELQLLDARRVLDGIRSIIEALLPKSVELVVEMPADALSIRVNPGLLEQVVVNLVVNASDAMEGRGTLWIRGSVREGNSVPEAFRRPGELVEVSVEDTGKGMDEETRRNAFTPYFTTKETGTGLGLATVKRIVEEVGGGIDVRSEPGKGTEIRLLFPHAVETAHG